MKRVITFNKNGNGSEYGLLRIPIDILKILNISPNENNINIKFIDNKIILEKCNYSKESRKITFDSKGIGILRIPKIYLEVLNLSKENRKVNITLKDNKIIITNIKDL